MNVVDIVIKIGGIFTTSTQSKLDRVQNRARQNRQVANLSHHY